MKKWVKGILALSIIAGIGFGGNYLWSKTNHSRLDDSSIEADADVEGVSSLTLQPVDKEGASIAEPIPVDLKDVNFSSNDTYREVLETAGAQNIGNDGKGTNYVEALKYFSLVNNNESQELGKALYGSNLKKYVKNKFGENTIEVAEKISVLSDSRYTLNENKMSEQLNKQVGEQNTVNIPFEKSNLMMNVTGDIFIQYEDDEDPNVYHGDYMAHYDVKYYGVYGKAVDLENSQIGDDEGALLTPKLVTFDGTNPQAVSLKVLPEDLKVSDKELREATIKYDFGDNKVNIPSEQVVYGLEGEEQTVKALDVAGFDVEPKSYNFVFGKDDNKDFTFKYTKQPESPSPKPGDNNGGGSGGGSVIDTDDKDTETNVNDKSTSSVGNNNTTNTTNVTKSVTPFKVYGKQKLYRYSHANFTNKRRVQAHAKKVKAHAPVFTVVGKTTSSNGAARYKLSDGTHITASDKYVGKLYWNGSYKKLHVTNPKGINTYKTNALSGKVKHVKQGTTVAVKQISKKNGMTRYQLANGKYISGSKKLVSPTKPKQVKKVKAKTTVRLYKDVDLKKVVKTYKKGSVINVKGWDHSHGNVHHVSGYKRYKVAGGYITANSKYVKIAQ